MDNRGQGALEYLLLIGGAVVVAAIVVVLLLGMTEGSQDVAQHTFDQTTSNIEGSSPF